jgi:hypothetical protein
MARIRATAKQTKPIIKKNSNARKRSCSTKTSQVVVNAMPSSLKKGLFPRKIFALSTSQLKGAEMKVH